LAEKPSILVIDDEEIVRISCQRVLAPLGYEVVTATSGAAGLDLVRDREFDLVLTDLKMPDMDGLEVMSRIKGRLPKAKVIIITGYSTVEVAVRALGEGAFKYIEKPFTPDTLLAAVREALEDRGGQESA
jgi:DNA-binding NtrC family response regulator